MKYEYNYNMYEYVSLPVNSESKYLVSVSLTTCNRTEFNPTRIVQDPLQPIDIYPN